MSRPPRLSIDELADMVGAKRTVIASAIGCYKNIAPKPVFETKKGRFNKNGKWVVTKKNYYHRAEFINFWHEVQRLKFEKSQPVTEK